jgi:phosphoribosylformylglycinamidine synthase
MAMGERPPVALLNPAASARLAVAEAISNIMCANIEQISDIKLSANWMAAAGQKGEDQALFEGVKAIGMEMCPAWVLLFQSVKTHFQCVPLGRMKAKIKL